MIRKICEPIKAPQLRTFLACGTREEGERKVLEDFRERLYQVGVLPRTVGANSDLKASSQTEALALAYEEIQKADFILAMELRRYHIDGYLPSIWTLGIEPILGFLKGKPVYVFAEEGVRLEGPLREVALEVVEFDRDLLNCETESNRIGQWLQVIGEQEKERKEKRKQKICALLGGAVITGIAGVLLYKRHRMREAAVSSTHDDR